MWIAGLWRVWCYQSGPTGAGPTGARLGRPRVLQFVSIRIQTKCPCGKEAAMKIHAVIGMFAVFSSLATSQTIAPGERLCLGVVGAGVHDTSHRYSTSFDFEYLKTKLKEAHFADYQQYERGGVSIGLDIPLVDDIVGFTVDAHRDSGLFQRQLSQFYSSTLQQRTSSRTFLEDVSKVSDSWADVTKKCIELFFSNTDRVRLAVTITPTDYKVFQLTVQGYKPSYQEDPRQLIIRSIEPPYVKCAIGPTPVSLNYTAPGLIVSMTCTKKPKEAANLVVWTNDFGLSEPILLPAEPTTDQSKTVETNSDSPPSKSSLTLEVKTAELSSPIGPYPGVEAVVPDDDRKSGFVRVGGGCSVSFHGAGSEHAEVMVTSIPTETGWKCTGADPPGIPNPGTATATVIYARALGGKLSCSTLSAASGLQRYPSAQVALGDLSQQGYVLTAGGCSSCSSSYAGHGSAHAESVVSSIPLPGQVGWLCQGADPPNVPNSATMTAYLVACRIEESSFEKSKTMPKLVSRDFVPENAAGPQRYPISAAPVGLGFDLTGGWMRSLIFRTWVTARRADDQEFE
jgi:hypothetical protein